jgi:hypothetical protein
MLYWVQTLVAVVGCVRSLWGLLRDIKKQDPEFHPVHWANHTKEAIKYYRQTGANYAELRYRANQLAEKTAALKCYHSKMTSPLKG